MIEATSDCPNIAVILGKVRFALKKELDSNDWKVFVAEQKRIIIERVNEEDCVISHETPTCFSQQNEETFTLQTLINALTQTLTLEKNVPTNTDNETSFNETIQLQLQTLKNSIDLIKIEPEVGGGGRENLIPVMAVSEDQTGKATEKPESVAVKKKRGRPKKKSNEEKQLSSESVKAQFACSQCSKTFLKKTLLDAHSRKKHSTEHRVPSSEEVELSQEAETDVGGDVNADVVREIMCDLCGLEFDSKTSFTKHREKEHKNEVFLCNSCGSSFKSKNHLRRHVAKAHDSRTWPCKICGKHFNNLKHVRRHELSVHLGKTKLDCPTCGKTCSTKENLGRHIQSIHEGKKVLCEICGKGFTAAHSMKVHVELVHMGKRVPCDFCGKEMSEIHMRRHIRSVHQGVRYACSICDKSYDRPYRLRKHKEAAHGMQGDDDEISAWISLPLMQPIFGQDQPLQSLEVIGAEVDLMKTDSSMEENPCHVLVLPSRDDVSTDAILTNNIVAKEIDHMPLENF